MAIIVLAHWETRAKELFWTLLWYTLSIFYFSRLGEAWVPSDELCGHLERFVCRLYGFWRYWQHWQCPIKDYYQEEGQWIESLANKRLAKASQKMVCLPNSHLEVLWWHPHQASSTKESWLEDHRGTWTGAKVVTQDRQTSSCYRICSMLLQSWVRR